MTHWITHQIVRIPAAAPSIWPGIFTSLLAISVAVRRGKRLLRQVELRSEGRSLRSALLALCLGAKSCVACVDCIFLKDSLMGLRLLKGTEAVPRRNYGLKGLIRFLVK